MLDVARTEDAIWFSDALPDLPVDAEFACALGEASVFDSFLDGNPMASGESPRALAALENVQQRRAAPKGVHVPKRRLEHSVGDTTPTGQPSHYAPATSPPAKKPRRKGAAEDGAPPEKAGRKAKADAGGSAPQSADAQQLVSSKPRPLMVSKRMRARDDLEAMRALMLHYIFNF